jgi:predicted AAA+ superfamily ATPase
MIRLLKPAEKNLKKRLIKSPKVYLRDTGILHCLLEIEDYDHILSHPVSGTSWEIFAMENIIAAHQHWRHSYLRTSNGAEVDLILERGNRHLFFEFKLSKAPKPSRGFYELKDSLKPEMAFVIAPVDNPYEVKKGVMISSPESVIQEIEE